MNLAIKSALPDPSVSHFVHSLWMLENKTKEDVAFILLPNGMVDMNLMSVNSGNWKMVVRGVDTVPGEATVPAHTRMYAVGFKLLAVEYLLKSPVKDVLNFGRNFEDDHWRYSDKELESLESFCETTTRKIKTVYCENSDPRKKKLFELIYSTKGSVTVKELSEHVAWSSRQINRYFNDQFGISLKTYCNILRFGASFKQLSEGNLFPEQNFTDQTHFIKEIRKYAGVTPKELSKNKDGRFIDITAIKNFPA
ncbi:transcriptional regulator [Sphingobacteriaceae bacterium]|nr:transcriptional regulator [Sphingobacteriaceae bacterium]